MTSARAATDVSALYARVSPGVVSVETQTVEGGATGSGFVLDKNGYILTNEHVVDGAQTVRVRFPEGGPVTARVVGSDTSSDLALLKVDPSDHALTPLTLGSSKTLKVGQPAIAIGSPYRLEGTLTTGVISAVGRSIESPNNFPIDGALQTDAAINPGNSGGPLLDSSGRVIGINSQIASDSGSNDGVGFAIAIDTAKEILPALKAGREIKRPFLGISTGDATTGTGAIVAQVIGGGPADRAGLRARRPHRLDRRPQGHAVQRRVLARHGAQARREGRRPDQSRRRRAHAERHARHAARRRVLTSARRRHDRDVKRRAVLLDDGEAGELEHRAQR